MTVMQDFDINRFRVTDEEMATIAAERKAKTTKATSTNGEKKASKAFVLYPIEQYTSLARAGHYRALALYGSLLYLTWKAGRPAPIPVTNKLAATVGLNRWAKVSALQKLEELGLIRVQRHRCASPSVTLVKPGN
jgi:hypothetical protein